MTAPAGDYRRTFHATIAEVLGSAVRIIAADPLLLIPAPKSCTTRKAAALCSRLPACARRWGPSRNRKRVVPSLQTGHGLRNWWAGNNP